MTLNENDYHLHLDYLTYKKTLIKEGLFFTWLCVFA